MTAAETITALQARIANLQDEILTLQTRCDLLADENDRLSNELGIKSEPSEPREWGC